MEERKDGRKKGIPHRKHLLQYLTYNQQFVLSSKSKSYQISKECKDHGLHKTRKVGKLRPYFSADLLFPTHWRKRIM